MDLAAEVLRSVGSVRLQVRGSSMLPSLLPGDVLTVSSRNAETIQCGDLVVFTRGGFFVVHRVVRRVNVSGANRLITRGDALAKVDAPVLETELLGQVILIERGTKSWQPPRRITPFARLVGSAVRRVHAVLISFSLWRHVRPLVRKAVFASPGGEIS